MDLKLQPDSRRELARIAVGTLVCSAIMVALFGALHVADLVPFTYTVPLAALVGSGVTILNFYLLCLTMQNAVSVRQDAARVKGIIQLSYNFRLLLQAGWCIVAYVAPCFQVVAGMMPLLFPRLVIVYLQKTGRYPDGDPLPEADAGPDPSTQPPQQQEGEVKP